MIEMKYFDCEENPIVVEYDILVLKEKDGERFLIANAGSEINLVGVAGLGLSRAALPQIYEAIRVIINALEVGISRTFITGMKDNVPSVKLVLEKSDGKEIEVNFDPVTAVLICHYGELPILVPEEILEENGMLLNKEKNKLVPIRIFKSSGQISKEEEVAFENTEFGKLISSLNLDDFGGKKED